MAKYYIKIYKDKYTLDSKDKESAIYYILNNLKSYSYDTAVYISEKGFDGNSWVCSKIDSFFKNNK